MKLRRLFPRLVAFLFLSSCSSKPASGDLTALPSGLKFKDLIAGTGAGPVQGHEVVVHYTGWLENGTKFDSSLDRGQPFVFPIGAGRVIRGWDEGVMTMKAGITHCGL